MALYCPFCLYVLIDCQAGVTFLETWDGEEEGICIQTLNFQWISVLWGVMPCNLLATVKESGASVVR